MSYVRKSIAHVRWRHVTHVNDHINKYVLAHMNELCRAHESHVTCLNESSTLHSLIPAVYTNESCHIHEEPCDTYERIICEWVMSQSWRNWVTTITHIYVSILIWVSHVTRLKESRHTFEWWIDVACTDPCSPATATDTDIDTDIDTGIDIDKDADTDTDTDADTNIEAPIYTCTEGCADTTGQHTAAHCNSDTYIDAPSCTCTEGGIGDSTGSRCVCVRVRVCACVYVYVCACMYICKVSSIVIW